MKQIEDLSVTVNHGTLITMDHARTVIPGGAVGISGDRIAFVGSSSELGDRRGATMIDAGGCVVIPGLIDTDWDDFMERIYFQESTPEFWRVEARLSGLEKLKFGVTTGMSMLGSYPR
jgi:cytosine/adenosine deaminase-related metal-dependent hydrolase